MIYAMMNKTTNWMPLVRHKRSQNPRVVYMLVDEVMAAGDALMRQSPFERALVAEGESRRPGSVFSAHVGNRVRAHECHRQHSPTLGDREMVHPRRRSGRIAGGQGLGPLGVELVSHPSQEG